MGDEVTIVGAGVNPHRQIVRQEGQAETFAISVTEFQNVSALSRLSFNWSMVGVDPGTGADTALAVRNDSSSLVLHIEDVIVSSDTATEIDVHLTDGAAFTPTGTAVVGVCFNRTAPRVADATAIADETQNTQGNIIHSQQIGADAPYHLHLGGSLLLGKNDVIAVDITADTTGVNCDISGFYVIPDEERV